MTPFNLSIIDLLQVLISWIGLPALLLIWYKSERDKRIHLERLINEDRTRAYKKYLDLIKGVLRKAKEKKGSNSHSEYKELIDESFNTKFELIPFASENVILKLNQMDRKNYKPVENKKELKDLKFLGKIILDMRKDIGLKDRKLNEVDILQMFINENISLLESKYQKFKKFLFGDIL